MTWKELQTAIEAQGVTDDTVLEKVSWQGGLHAVEVRIPPYRHPTPHHVRTRIPSPVEARVEPPAEEPATE